MPRSLVANALLPALLLLAPARVLALVHAGDVAPNFTKPTLAGPTVSLSDFIPGHVVVLNLVGCTCAFCIEESPLLERDIWKYYQSRNPNELEVLGADIYSCNIAGVKSFRDQTGITYPLLMYAGGSAGGSLTVLYGGLDDYIVINKHGIVRYRAFDVHPSGRTYFPNELRACIDSLISHPVGVEDERPRGYGLEATPNPFRHSIAVTLAQPLSSAAIARVTVRDLAGRTLATLWAGPVAPGFTRLSWSGRTDAGATAAPGVYLLRADLGEVRLSRRIVLLH